jgi:hypothetical protein
VSSGLPAADLYRLIEELIEVLYFVVKAEHYRTAKDNKLINFGKQTVRTLTHVTYRVKDRETGKIQELVFPEYKIQKVPKIGTLSLEEIRKFRSQRRVALPVQAELDTLEKIQECLVSLRLNQSPSRRFRSFLSKEPETSRSSSRRSKKNKKRKKYFYK